MLQRARRNPDVESSQGRFYDQTGARELLGAVKRTIFPSLWQHSQPPVRIWVVGCGAGEVVYSLAAMWVDFLERAGSADRAFRVFGTDANAGAIAAAREGRYDNDIRDPISPAHLERFFAPTESGYRVLVGLRERCVFGQHDILNDPVFSMLDLIVCCSPWLALPLDAQHRVGRGFRTALRPQRWLVLGSGQADALPGFDCLDGQQGIFQRTATRDANETTELDAARADLECARQEIAVLSAEMADRSAASERLSAILDADSLAQRDRMHQHIALESALLDQRERRRIAGELHDRIGQSLALVQLKLKTMFWASRGTARATLGEAVSLIEASIVETRTLIFELSPPVLYDLGLKAALSWLAEEFEKRDGLVIEVSDDGQQARLDDPVAGLLFRSVRELLMNVSKHAKVSRAKVVLRSVDDHLEILVSDAGRGFPPPEPNASVREHGRGLVSVREEISWLGGTLSIRAAPGRGTEVQLRVPLAVATGNSRR
jgi:signal transduction histidine kinase